MKVRVFLSIMICCLITNLNNLFAQQKNIAMHHHAWFVLHTKARIHDNWNVVSAAHIRRHKLGRDWQQFLLRGGVNYRLNQNVSLGAAYTFLKFYPYGQQPMPVRMHENRSHIHVQINHVLEQLQLSHRYRLEQRWLENFERKEEGSDEYVKNGYTYLNRVRYKLGMKYPFGREEKYFFEMYDEVWINFGNNVVLDTFSQNWWGVNFGINPFDHIVLKLGYMNQFLHKSNGYDYESNHTLKCKLYYTFDFRTSG